MIPIALCVVILVVFLADLAVKGDNGRGLGALATIGLVGVLGVSFIAPMGTSFGGAYIQDHFALYVQRIVLIAGLLGCLGSIDHAGKAFAGRQGEYYLMLLFSMVGMSVLPAAREVVLLVVAFELMGIPLYVLAAMHKKVAQGIEGTWKLYLTGAVSSAITLYGLSFIVGGTGTSSLTQLATLSSAPPMVELGMFLVQTGCWAVPHVDSRYLPRCTHTLCGLPQRGTQSRRICRHRPSLP